MSSRFANFHDLVKPTLADASVHLEVTRWFPGEPWPMPEYVAPPDHSVRLFKAVDKSGYVGPTGTMVDGLLNLVGTVAEDYINELITLMARPDVPEYKLPGWFGTATKAPFVVFPEGKYSPYCLLGNDHPQGHGVRHGHRRQVPQWVNSAAKLAANAALGYLGAAIGNPGLALGVFDFLIEDVILAFHRVANTMLKERIGPDADPEAWVQGPGVGSPSPPSRPSVRGSGITGGTPRSRPRSRMARLGASANTLTWVTVSRSSSRASSTWTTSDLSSWPGTARRPRHGRSPSVMTRPRRSQPLDS